MADVVVFHLVGAADLGIGRDDDPAPALAALGADPERILEGARRHPGDRPAPLPSTIDAVNELGHRVTGVVLFVTDQTPPHRSDTARWLEPLRAAIPTLSALNDDHPINVDVEVVPEMSISAFAEAARLAAYRQVHQVVVPIAGGAKAGFLGLLIGATASGQSPLVLPVNREGDASAATSVVEVDLVRWLVRRRMWSAVAAFDGADDDLRALARDLDAFERENLRRGRAELPADHLAPVLSRMISDWATEEPTWVTHISRLVDELTERTVKQLPPRDREALRLQAQRWVRQSPDVAGRSDADVCTRVAARRPVLWTSWKACPPHLQDWLSEFASLDHAKRARHGTYPVHPLPRVGTSTAHRLLAEVALGHSPGINPPLKDPLFLPALRDLLPTVHDSPAPGIRVALRIAGQRELDAPQMAATVETHHRASCTADEVTHPVLVIASNDTAQDGAVIIDAHDPMRARREALDALRTRCDEIENSGPVRIRRVALYLNQGTQVMAQAALAAAISLAAERGAELELLDLRVTDSGDSAVIALPSVDVARLVHHALPADAVRKLLAASIETLHLGQAQILAELLGDHELTARVRDLGKMVLRPLDGVAREALGERLSRIAPGLALVLKLRPLLGDRDTVGRVAVMLSAAVSADKEDRWDEIDELEPLRHARNAVFHRRDGFTYPTGLSTEVLDILAQHFKVTVDRSEINAAITHRADLLRDLAPTGVAG